MSFEKRVLIGAALAVAVIAAALALWASGFVLMLLFAAILVGVFLRGLANLLSERTPLAPGLSLAVVLLVLIGLLTGLGFVLAPRLRTQFKELRQTLPAAWERVQDYARTLPLGDELVDASRNQDLLTSDAVQSRLPRVFSGTLSGVVQIAFVVITGIYLAAKPQAYIRAALLLFPARRRDRLCATAGAIGYALQWWLIGQLLIMIFVGAATAIGLALLSVPLALTLGVIAGALDFIPNVGPILAAIPGVLIALLASPEQAAYVLLLYLGIQQLEGYVLTPLVHRRTVSLEPALIITAQLGFGLAAGALGILLATPMVAAAVVAVKLLYIEDVLGERMDVEGAAPATACAPDSA